MIRLVSVTSVIIGERGVNFERFISCIGSPTYKEPDYY